MNDKVQLYLEAYQSYYRNAHVLKSESRAKAGEVLWGAFAELLKAIAIQKFEKPLPQGHRNIVRAYEEIASQLGDKRIFEGGRAAEKLHAHFYEQFLHEEEWAENFDKVVAALGKLEAVLLQ